MNVFDKPIDPRELAHLGLARTFVQVRAEGKLVFTLPSAAESRKATFVQVRAEAKLAWIMPNTAESGEDKRNFKNL